MSVWDMARKDMQSITGGSDWGVELVFTTPDGLITATVKGIASKHSLVIDGTGAPINGRNTHVSVAEKFLTDLSYPTRNANGEVYMVKHTVSWTDATGISKTYRITEQMPDETLGLILFPGLTDYKP